MTPVLFLWNKDLTNRISNSCRQSFGNMIALLMLVV